MGLAIALATKKAMQQAKTRRRENCMLVKKTMTCIGEAIVLRERDKLWQRAGIRKLYITLSAQTQHHRVPKENRNTCAPFVLSHASHAAMGLLASRSIASRCR